MKCNVQTILVTDLYPKAPESVLMDYRTLRVWWPKNWGNFFVNRGRWYIR